MQRIHYFIISSLFVTFAACQQRNANYCPGTPEDQPCPPQVGGNCTSADDCTPPSQCNLDKGLCVECLDDRQCTNANKPVCDTAKNVCAQCQRNDQCTSELCLDDGTCANSNEVTYVSGSGADNPTCAKDMPCKLLESALKPTALRKYVKVSGRITSSDASVAITIDGMPLMGRVVAIYGDPGTSILSRGADGLVLDIKKGANVALFNVEIRGNGNAGDGVSVKDASTVTMTGVKISSHGGTGASLVTGSLMLSRSEITDNRTFGIVATGGTLTIDHSWIYKNTGDTGIRASGAGTMVNITSSVIAGNTGAGGGLSMASKFSIVNNIIAANGNAADATIGGALLSATSGTFDFNTVAYNVAAPPPMGTSGIVCGSGTRKITNSILTNNDVDIINCTTIAFSLTAVSGIPLPGMGNKTGEPMFLKTSNVLDPQFYRIGRDSAARDSADPAATLESDIDGQLRPRPDQGMRMDMGADEYIGN